MDEIELKHCPFCGVDAEMQQGKYQGLRTFYVSCLGCGARTDLEYAEEFAADLLLRLRMGWTDLGTYRLWGHAGV